MQAQSITEDAITMNRHILQLEGAALIEEYRKNGMDDIHWTFPSLLLRYGLQSNIELRLATALEGKKHIHRLENGLLGNIEIGVKLRLIKSSSTNLSMTNHLIFSTTPDKFKHNEVDAVTSLIASQDIGQKWQLGAAIQYIFEDSPQRDLNYSGIVYYNINTDWQIYIETYGEVLSHDFITNLDTGVNWQLTPKFQWQLSAGTNLKEIYHFASTGFVWQIN